MDTFLHVSRFEVNQLMMFIEDPEFLRCSCITGNDDVMFSHLLLSSLDLVRGFDKGLVWVAKGLRYPHDVLLFLLLPP